MGIVGYEEFVGWIAFKIINELHPQEQLKKGLITGSLDGGIGSICLIAATYLFLLPTLYQYHRWPPP
jgi:hypothetical protein